jgi:hypothetical protein
MRIHIVRPLPTRPHLTEATPDRSQRATARLLYEQLIATTDGSQQRIVLPPHPEDRPIVLYRPTNTPDAIYPITLPKPAARTSFAGLGPTPERRHSRNKFLLAPSLTRLPSFASSHAAPLPDFAVSCHEPWSGLPRRYAFANASSAVSSGMPSRMTLILILESPIPPQSTSDVRLYLPCRILPRYSKPVIGPKKKCETGAARPSHPVTAQLTATPIGNAIGLRLGVSR